MSGLLDETDRAIIHLLMRDGRMPAAVIARHLPALSERAIQYRIRRLLENEVIRVIALLEPERLGYGARADVAIDLEPGQVHQVARRLAEPDVISYVACYFGRHDISFTVHAPSNEHLYTFLTETVAVVPGIRSTAVTLVPLLLKYSHEWMPANGAAGVTPYLRLPDPTARRPAPPRLDRLDQGIVNLLIGNGRLPAATIARELGNVSAQHVLNRIEALVRSGVITITAVFNPEAVGYPVRADVLIEVEVGHVLQVARLLAELPFTSRVACSMGGEEIAIQVYARDTKELYRHVTDEIHAIPHLKRTQTSLVAELVKEFYDCHIPDFAVYQDSIAANTQPAPGPFASRRS